MKKKKCIAAGALAAFLLCESLFTPNLAGMGAGLLKVQAAAANVALNKEVTSSANESAIHLNIPKSFVVLTAIKHQTPEDGLLVIWAQTVTIHSGW